MNAYKWLGSEGTTSNTWARGCFVPGFLATKSQKFFDYQLWNKQVLFSQLYNPYLNSIIHFIGWRLSVLNQSEFAIFK